MTEQQQPCCSTRTLTIALVGAAVAAYGLYAEGPYLVAFGVTVTLVTVAVVLWGYLETVQ